MKIKLISTAIAVFFAAAAHGAGPVKRKVEHSTPQQNAPESTPLVRLTESPLGGRTADAEYFGIFGTSIVQATINTSGFAEDFRIEKSLGYGLDEACANVLRRSRWQPGTYHGLPQTGTWRLVCTWSP